MNKNYLTGAVLKQYSSTTPALYFTLSYRHLFDTTISAEEDWESGETKRVTKALGDQGRLNDWFLGVGLSGAFWIGTGEYNRLKRPFLPIISYEMLQFEERGEGHMTHSQQNMFGYGLTFGWDIRANRIQSWILRTNLRVYPDLGIAADHKQVAFSNVEFNFIQLIIYPDRFFN